MEEKLVWIEKVVKKGKNYLVYIKDEENPLTFNEDQIVNNRIIKGNSFLKKDWKKITDSLDQGMVLDKTMKYIDYKVRTVKEIEDYLDEKGYDETFIIKIVKQLKQLKFLDDDRYTKIYLEEAIKNQKGPVYIKHDLMTRGIDNDTILKYLSTYDEELIYDNALDMATKTLKTLKGLPIKKQKESIMNRLLRMGYEYTTVNKVLNVIEYNEMDKEILKAEYVKLLTKELDKNQIVTKLLQKGYEYQDIKNVISEN